MDMRPVFRREVVRGAKARWLEQYKAYDDKQKIGVPGRSKSVGDTRRELAKLDAETASAEQIEAAIDATGWTDLDCELCGKPQEVVLRIGQEPDYEARWVDLCPECLASAGAALATAKQER